MAARAKTMAITRRSFVRSAAAAGCLLPNTNALVAETERTARWRTFELTTRVEILNVYGETRVWLPTPLAAKTPFQRTLSNNFKVEVGTAHVLPAGTEGPGMISAVFSAGIKPVLTSVSRVATRDYAIDSGTGGRAPKLTAAERVHFLQATRLVPTDGIVKTTADSITRGVDSDLEKAQAIYNWIVDHTHRDSKVPGCGRGNIRFLLESGDLGGKCADLNRLYVALARASGLPARDAYGIRTTKSELGYRSLGPSSGNVTKAQHCRAEVYVRNYGWVPVDPADVRKVMLEEPPGHLAANDEMVKKARKLLFGSWEMNWLAFNFAQDVQLPGSKGGPIGFFMYPQAETSEGRLDSLNSESFRYEITSREMTA